MRKSDLFYKILTICSSLEPSTQIEGMRIETNDLEITEAILREAIFKLIN